LLNLVWRCSQRLIVTPLFSVGKLLKINSFIEITCLIFNCRTRFSGA
jgi:hypothetical protein